MLLKLLRMQRPSRKRRRTEKKLQATGEHKTEAKRETKKKGNELSSEGDAKTVAVSADAFRTQPAATIATVVPASVEVSVVPKVEAGVISTKGPRVGPVGYRVSVNATPGSDASGDKDRVHREKETATGTGAEGATGVHSGAGHSQNSEVEISKTDASSVRGSGEIGVKSHGAGATATVVAIDGAISGQGVVQKHSDGAGNKGVLWADTVGAEVAGSQEASGGDAVLVNDGHRTLSATATSLEVGVANGSHGWLKIRGGVDGRRRSECIGVGGVVCGAGDAASGATLADGLSAIGGFEC